VGFTKVHCKTASHIMSKHLNLCDIQTVDKIMETQRNLIEFVLATLIELQLETQNVLPMFTFCSACVSALVMALSDSPCERIGKWETCPIWKRTDHWCAFSWEHP
jgi:hypothetical protein